MYEFTCVRVYLGIDIHKITLSTLVGYHIGYLVDLASFLCLSFLFSFLFSFAYEYANLSKYMYMSTDNLLASLPTSLSIPTKEVSTIVNVVPRRRKENSIRSTDTSCLRFESKRQKDHNSWIDISNASIFRRKSIKISSSIIDAYH